MKNRLEEYVNMLYNDNGGEILKFDSTLSGPPIMQDEIRAATKAMKKVKVAGEDEIVIGMIEATEEFRIRKITDVANRNYESGYIPNAMRESVFVSIPKKSGALECSTHRTISIMSQLGKVLLRVVMSRLKGKMNERVLEEQHGFRKGTGTNSAIFALRMIIERSVEMQKTVYLCFVDSEKAFDTVKHEELVNILKSTGMDGKDTRLIGNLYWNQKAAVRIENKVTDRTEIKRGVRQGCVLSPDFFSLYSQVVMDALKDLEGISVGGRNVNNVRYADDTVLIADSEKKLQALMNKLKDECASKGLRINVDMTNTLTVTKSKEKVKVKIKVGETEVKQVESFVYLGSTSTDQGNSEKDIVKRIGLAKKTFGDMDKLLKNLSMSISLE